MSLSYILYDHAAQLRPIRRFQPSYTSLTKLGNPRATAWRDDAWLMSDDEITALLDQLSRQQALQTQALRAALEGRWTDGADSVAGYLLALDPEAQIEAKAPLYP